MPPLFARVRERKVVQWALAYLAAGWLGLQVVSLLAGAFGWPPGVVRVLAILLGLGFPAALVLAWFHGENGEQRAGTVEIALLGTLLLVALLLVAKVGWRSAAGAATTATPPVPTEQGSIAVLPFLDLSAAHDQAYFSDGLAEELLDVLARLPGLHVAGRTSSFSFRDRAAPADSSDGPSTWRTSWRGASGGKADASASPPSSWRRGPDTPGGARRTIAG